MRTHQPKGQKEKIFIVYYNLFVASRVGNESLDTAIRGIIPFLICQLVCLMLITYVPVISTWLPNLLMR